MNVQSAMEVVDTFAPILCKAISVLVIVVIY